MRHALTMPAAMAIAAAALLAAGPASATAITYKAC